uniref:Uncharacterized protein n=1 Tax=Anguilla anguilla TaxID=7936 RepID=A0A0E9S9W6_ANGAN
MKKLKKLVAVLLWADHSLCRVSYRLARPTRGGYSLWQL